MFTVHHFAAFLCRNTNNKIRHAKSTFCEHFINFRFKFNFYLLFHKSDLISVFASGGLSHFWDDCAKLICMWKASSPPLCWHFHDHSLSWSALSGVKPPGSADSSSKARRIHACRTLGLLPRFTAWKWTRLQNRFQTSWVSSLRGKWRVKRQSHSQSSDSYCTCFLSH